MEFFGIKFVGLNAENGHRLLLTLAIIAAVIILRYMLSGLARLILRGNENKPIRFWMHQGISLALAAILILGVLSIWFEDSTRLATFLGLFSAGLAFALQRVIMSIAGYFVILRGRTFSVGDRIMMGGVRGDVIALNFTQTTVMEMGQPPGERPDDPNVWVRSRQFTGRIVTITNDKIFDEPVFNYSREFPYLWEEMMLPIAYKDDRHRAEQILLKVAERHTAKLSELSQEALRRFQQRYYMLHAEVKSKVYYRLTDNWLELTVRFIVKEHGSRELKDKMSREILEALDEAGIGLASATYDIVGFPPIRIENGTPFKAEQRSQQGKG